MGHHRFTKLNNVYVVDIIPTYDICLYIRWSGNELVGSKLEANWLQTGNKLVANDSKLVANWL